MSVEAVELQRQAHETQVVGADAVSAQRFLSMLRGMSRVFSLYPGYAPERMSEHFGHAEGRNDPDPSIDLSTAR